MFRRNRFKWHRFNTCIERWKHFKQSFMSKEQVDIPGCHQIICHRTLYGLSGWSLQGWCWQCPISSIYWLFLRCWNRVWICLLTFMQSNVKVEKLHWRIFLNQFFVGIQGLWKSQLVEPPVAYNISLPC